MLKFKDLNICNIASESWLLRIHIRAFCLNLCSEFINSEQYARMIALGTHQDVYIDLSFFKEIVPLIKYFKIIFDEEHHYQYVLIFNPCVLSVKLSRLQELFKSFDFDELTDPVEVGYIVHVGEDDTELKELDTVYLETVFCMVGVVELPDNLKILQEYDSVICSCNVFSKCYTNYYLKYSNIAGVKLIMECDNSLISYLLTDNPIFFEQLNSIYVSLDSYRMTNYLTYLLSMCLDHTDALNGVLLLLGVSWEPSDCQQDIAEKLRAAGVDVKFIQGEVYD